ncbi:hypothetical protein [Pseudomonas sp. MWU12-2323]|uniref:hypothetical protein n=1 Tax=Pseudomonas sp. MWU12-2323 TaxID=2651296 RepID=UPI00128D9C8F|nr:hypothetical protein [Pseudomonas sp. MWU12-2323]MPQ69270.1 hypothetical protein [Pseudomonas sp. MWU12-2323]
MGKRWAVASDPKLLARIAEQDRLKGAQSAPPHTSALTKLGLDASPGAGKKEPSYATRRAQKVALNNQDSRLDSLHYDEACNTLTIVLVGAELLSHNTSLRMHSAKTTKLKTTWLKRIEALMLTNLTVYDRWKENQKGAFPLVVEEVYATGENNCLDVESVTAACKPIIDALVRTRFIPDDSPDYIAQPISYTFRQPNNGLVLVLRPAPKPWGEISDSTMDRARLIPASL